jgi:hypothetical protein
VSTEPEVVPPVIWLTRDRVGGELSTDVDIWSVSPKRHVSEDGDVMWLPPLALIDGHTVMCIGGLSIAQARLKYGSGVPDTDMECTRIASTFYAVEVVHS